MLISRTKKYIGLILALAIVLGSFIFNPEEVKADAGIQPDEVYTVTDSDYKYQLSGYCAAYAFTPAETGYYVICSDVYFEVLYFKEFGVNSMTGVGYEHLGNDPYIGYFDVEPYYYDNHDAYYMEAGVEYYLVHYYSEYQEKQYGDFCVSKTEEYIGFDYDRYIDAVKDSAFTLWVELDATVDYDSVTFTWYDENHDVLKVDQNVEVSAINLETNDCFNDEDFGRYGEYYYPAFCIAEVDYDGWTFSRYINMEVRPCENILATACWAEAVRSGFVFVNNYDASGKVLTVNAGTFAPCCDVTYEWYMTEDFGDTYELLEGQNSNQLSAAVLGEPHISYYDVGWCFTRRSIYCKVTFDDGLNTVIRKVHFDVIYGLENEFIGNRTITANYGDVISFPVEGGFEEPLKDLGYSYWYQWIGNVNTGDGEYQFGTMNTVTIDTSMLEVEHGSEGDYSVIQCTCHPYYDDEPYIIFDNLQYEFRIYYTDDINPDVKGIAVDSTNFPDDNFRQYVAEYIDVNHSGYISKDEIEYTTFIDVSNKDINDLTGINYFSNVYKLYCSNNTIDSLDVSGLKNLSVLRADGNGLSSIDISGCNYLKTVYLYDNMIASINIDGCPFLQFAYQYGPQSMISGGYKYYGVFDYYTMDTYDMYSGLALDNRTSVENYEPLNPQFIDFKISRQPEDVTCIIGDECTLCVEATGYDLTYQWQYMNAGSTVWCNATGEAAKTNAMSFTVTANANGRKYRCIVSDGTMELVSDVAIIYVVSAVTIVSQPVDFVCNAGEYAEFTVEAEGEDLEYQWQVLKNGEWANCSNKDGAKTDTLRLEAKDSRNGSVYQCVITGRNGYAVATESATLYVLTPLTIKAQPEDFSCAPGETATFTVVAEGAGLKYQWQTYKNGSWTNCSTKDGARTATLSLEAKDSRNGSVYRCVVTDKYGFYVITKSATLTVSTPLSIKQQPVDINGPEGNMVTFKVVAEGSGLKYQWQVFKNGAWTNCSINDGAKTDTLSLEIKPSRDGSIYHCIVTDKNGASVTSKEATLTMENELILVNGPENEIRAFSGTYVDFTIEAHGDGLKYQWQVFKNGEWTNCSVKDGAKTDTMTLEAKTSRDGLKYHCVVTDKYGHSATSDDITLFVTEFLTGSIEVTAPDITNCVATDYCDDTETVEVPEAELTTEIIEISEVVEAAAVIETVPEAEAVT